MLSNEELNELMIKINLPQFVEEVKHKNETRGRKPTDLYNHWYMELRTISDYEHLSSWVDDILTGAGRLSTGNSRVSPKLIFNLLKSLPFISTREIKEHMNSSRMRVLWGDVIEDDSYCRWLRAAVLSAMRSLDYHTEKGKKIKRYNEVSEKDFSFDLRGDIKSWEEQKAACNALGLQVTTNLANPLADVPIEDRKLLAGLTVDEINGIKVHSSSTRELNLDSLCFSKPTDKEKPIKRLTKAEFELVKKHESSYYGVGVKDLPTEMIDLDTGEILFYSTREINQGVINE